MGQKKLNNSLFLIDKNQSYAANAGIFFNKKGFSKSTTYSNLSNILNDYQEKAKIDLEKYVRTETYKPTQYYNLAEVAKAVPLDKVKPNTINEIVSKLAQAGNTLKKTLDTLFDNKNKSYNDMLKQTNTKELQINILKVSKSKKQNKNKAVSIIKEKQQNHIVVKNNIAKQKIQVLNDIASMILKLKQTYSINNFNYSSKIKTENILVNKSKSYYDYSEYLNKCKVNWGRYVDHIYILHSNKRNKISEDIFNEVGINQNISSYIYYKTNSHYNDIKFFKKAAFIDAIKDAYNKKYNKIIILTDDLQFTNNDVYIVSILQEIHKFHLAVLNTNDICEDCFYISKSLINFIVKENVDVSKENWYEFLQEKMNTINILRRIKVSKAICLHRIDYVFPYVDCNDLEWQKIHNKYTGLNNTINRYRTWDNLHFILRGIENCLPFISNIILLVMQESQVPEWINKEKVRIVYHKDFIPEKYLPTFSSCEIESFLCNIPNISEYFIYGNDDTFIINNLNPLDFFNSGMPKLKLNQFMDGYGDENFCTWSIRSFNLAIKEFEPIKNINDIYYRPEHGIISMLLTSCQHIYELNKKEIESGITMFRSDTDINQYVYSIYNWILNNKKIIYSICTRYIGVNNINKANKAASIILKNKLDIICINDCIPDIEDIEEHKNIINDAFNKKFPKKSKYEI